MLRFFIFLAVALLVVRPTLVAAQQIDLKKRPLEPLTEEQVKAEMQRLDNEMLRLQTDPKAPDSWKQQRKLHAELQKLSADQRQARDAIQTRINELGSRDDLKLWKGPIDDLQQRHNRLYYYDFELIREAGRKLYAARHAELLSFGPKETPELHRLGLDVLEFPRIDGSTSTRPLAALIACRCYDMPYAWTGFEQRRLPYYDPYDDSGDLDIPFGGPREPELELLEFTLQAKAERSEQERLATIINRLLAANASTPQAYKNLIEGRSDLGLLARRPSAEELALAKKANVEFDVVPCAWDAFVFLVNHENPVRNLTTAQIRDVYSGKVDDWKDVGGAAAHITPYQREEQSGSQELMRSLVMKELPFAKPKGQYSRIPNLIGRLMSSVFLELTHDTKGLAYSVYYYERFMAGSPRTRMLAVDGVEPTFENLRDRKYPYTTEVWIVTRKGIPADSPTAQLRAWLLSDEGQAVVRESGYVPLK